MFFLIQYIYKNLFLILNLLEEKKMKNLFAKYAGVIAALALMVTTVSVNRACVLFAYQPEMPEGAEKLRRL